MSAGINMRPKRVDIHGEETVRAELKRHTRKRGSLKGIAADAGIAVSGVYSIRTGNRPMAPSVAEQVGFTLAWVRAEELALADRIEAEMGIEWPIRKRGE